MGLRGLVYFVGTYTRPTVPRGRSAAALGDDATVAQILIPWHGIRVGKGLMLGLPAYDRALRCMGVGQLWQDQHRYAGDDVLRC